MTRNLKVLGLALTAVLAMSAVVAASGAQAVVPQFHCTSTTENCIVTGKSNIGKLLVTNVEVKCKENTGVAGARYEATIPKTGTTATITAAYGNPTTGKGCTLASLPLTVNMNGCDYTFNSVEPEAGLEGTATVDINCPAGKVIEIVSPSAPCTITIEPQTGLKHVTFTNSKTPEPTDVTANVTVTGIATISHGAGCPCPETETLKNGSLTDTITLEGFNDEPATKIEGAKVGFHVF